MNFGPQKSYSAHSDTTEVLEHCKLTQVHTARGSTLCPIKKRDTFIFSITQTNID